MRSIYFLFVSRITLKITASHEYILGKKTLIHNFTENLLRYCHDVTFTWSLPNGENLLQEMSHLISGKVQTFLSRDQFCRMGLSTCDALGLGWKWLALPTQLQRFCRVRRCSRDRGCLCINRLFIHRTPAWTIYQRWQTDWYARTFRTLSRLRRLHSTFWVLSF